MKKLLSVLSIMLIMTVSVKAQQNSGQLKIYVANKATVLSHVESGYKEKVNKGYLIAEVAGDDSETTVTSNGNTYDVESDWGEVHFLVPKADVEMKTYDITPLPISIIGKGLNFVSNDGLNARVFKSNLNGHRYANTSAAKDLGINLNSCYVLSIECIDENGTKVFVENPVGVMNGKILSNAYFPILWASGKGTGKSSYDQAGKLLYNQIVVDGEDYVAAYIGSEKALYFLGRLYYLTESATNIPTAEPAAPQSLDDFPISDILKLITTEVPAGNILKPAGYKYVGDYTSEAARTYIQTWCRNCIASKSGEVQQFQKGTSSIVCVVMAMGSPTTLSIEVFNTNARNVIINELKAISFVEEKGGNDNERNFSREEQTAMMKKSKKGWEFVIFPVVCE